jgi:hypothetical protein
LNDDLVEFNFDQTLHVDEACKTTERRKHMYSNLLTDFGFGRAFDLASNKTLYHLRLFYYTNKLVYDFGSLNESVNGMGSSELEFHKYGKLTGLKFLKIN